ncbi:M20/M25/M40 family metallo-hydrolase [Paenibacillus cymbidii]|uniref:M20/M25/M40 family metallo-hydrolase n=1 Tax=Paenibacillus cymbidii TaxID=1639034 RepID=UPI001080E0D3|nr:M20/M25/M40 family metallo-hydrolase [Paenibacillus cymbidii]
MNAEKSGNNVLAGNAKMVSRRDTEREVRSWIERNRTLIADTVSDLIRIPSVNHGLTGDEQNCQLHVAGMLRELGLRVDVFTPDEVEGLARHPAYYPGKNYADRPNVVGIWSGAGNGRSLLFSSHADTAVAATDWIRDPWRPEREGDRLYGLGSFDMKAGLAASALAVRCLKELGVRPLGDVIVESVVDEEFGGANGTLAARARGYQADGAVIPEPTNMAVCTATRGGALWKAAFAGTGGMSFSGETVHNPVIDAAQFIVFLHWYEQTRNAARPVHPSYADSPELPVIVTRVMAGDLSAPICDSGPVTCTVEFWAECHPGLTEQQFKEELAQRFSEWSSAQNGPKTAFPELTGMIRFLPGAETPSDSPLTAVLAQAVGRATGSEAIVRGAPFACDAFVFNLYSPTPAVVLGPRGANAHAPDEYVELSSLGELVEAYALAIMDWCGYDKPERSCSEG